MKVLFSSLLIILLAFGTTACEAKVTDPNDPNFDPGTFSFGDYKTREEKIRAFSLLFPPGTERQLIDQVLVETGGATKMKLSDFPVEWIVIRYDEPRRYGFPAGPAHSFIFDSDGLLHNVNFANTEYLFGDQVTTEKIAFEKDIGTEDE